MCIQMNSHRLIDTDSEASPCRRGTTELKLPKAIQVGTSAGHQESLGGNSGQTSMRKQSKHTVSLTFSRIQHLTLARAHGPWCSRELHQEHLTLLI